MGSAAIEFPERRRLRYPRANRRSAAGEQTANLFPAVVEPELPALDKPYGILVTGVGGTGVVTIGAIMGVAAHIRNSFTSSQHEGRL